MRLALTFVVLAALALMAYIRLAPSDPARWHVPVTGDENRDMPGGALRVLPAAPDSLGRLHRIALETPRTQVLAGSVEEGRITYVTRSRVMGFPDYTTVDCSDGKLRLFARLRFGSSDLGVNRARLEAWMAQL